MQDSLRWGWPRGWVGPDPSNRTNGTEVLVPSAMAAVSSTEAHERTSVTYSPSASLPPHFPQSLGGVLLLSCTQHHPPTSHCLHKEPQASRGGKDPPSWETGGRAWPSCSMKHTKGFQSRLHISVATCNQCLRLPVLPAPKGGRLVCSSPPWALQWWPSMGPANPLRHLEGCC